MRIVIREVKGVTILDLHGKIVDTRRVCNSNILFEAVFDLVRRGRTKIVLNLADVPYVDSPGLGAIVRSYSTVSYKGDEFKLLGPTKRMQDLLSITKLITVFETYESEDEAVRSFAEQKGDVA
ncbi:MAG: Anti-anti-sigma-B factor [Candidatus Parcubacteria bacterium]|jgi:anti-sigma B factor antagonist